MRTMIVELGHSDSIIERWGSPGPQDQMPGFVDVSVLLNRKYSADEEEVVIITRWDSEEAWKGWEKSDVHIQMHRQGRTQQRPSFIKDIKVKLYHQKAARNGSISL
ncbi:antibiotic biosynthesis monooxygenase family protein [Paenibacillus cellulosilyticus]|uniref:antibiotic biosynthesis monooxygenase family protein n=1 Tax=Paenibacillus cellulosilyticus TaxID=375489 RepID=UPI00248D0E6D|nr:antibiotic biosynthesis monooxygenase [Paenibacillus cellulosilyticus]